MDMLLLWFTYNFLNLMHIKILSHFIFSCHYTHENIITHTQHTHTLTQLSFITDICQWSSDLSFTFFQINQRLILMTVSSIQSCIPRVLATIINKLKDCTSLWVEVVVLFGSNSYMFLRRLMTADSRNVN